MSDRTTPDWLVEIQNRSWEPEILISGICLTFLFILSSYIYNFFAMLVQDFGVFDTVAAKLFFVSMILLTGFKIILIIHLVLRGVWTGLVGLSYAFPEGINLANAIKKDIVRVKPEILVTRIERICSLLFSFIFSSISFVMGMYLFSIPIILLFVIGMVPGYIRIFTLAYAGLSIVVILVGILLLLKPNSKLNRVMEKSTLNQVLAIYFTNVGKLKSLGLFAAYFLVVCLLTLSNAPPFEFTNDSVATVVSTGNMVTVDRDHYESRRNPELRIPKAVIDTFRVRRNSLELFVSLYRGDTYTQQAVEDDPKVLKKYDMAAGGAKFNLGDLYRVSIDEEPLAGLKWYVTSSVQTGQQGLVTTIPLDSFAPGYHELRLDKLVWNVKKDELKLIEDWDVIPFEYSPVTAGQPGWEDGR